MSWWDSIEKAGNISKIALGALKTAQQKIDDALDINEEELSEEYNLTLKSSELYIQSSEGSDCDDQNVHFNFEDSEIKCSGLQTSGLDSFSTESILDNPTQVPGLILNEVSIELKQTNDYLSFYKNAKQFKPSTLFRSYPNLSSMANEQPINRSISQINVTINNDDQYVSNDFLNTLNNRHTSDVNDNILTNTSTLNSIDVSLCIPISSHDLSVIKHMELKSNAVGNNSGVLQKDKEDVIIEHDKNSTNGSDMWQSGTLLKDSTIHIKHTEMSDFEDLSKLYAETKTILHNREAKIIQLSNENSMVHDVNAALRCLMKSMVESSTGPKKVDDLIMEFTKRLTEMQQQLSAVCQERDNFKRLVKNEKFEKNQTVNKNGQSKRMNQLERLIRNKDEKIEGLLLEGTKLAADQLKANTLIKKLNTDIKAMKDREQNQNKMIDQLNTDFQRIQSDYNAKSDLVSGYIVNLTKQSKTIELQEKELESSKLQIAKLERKVADQTELAESLENANAKLQDQIEKNQIDADQEDRLNDQLYSLRSDRDQLKVQLDNLGQELKVAHRRNGEQADTWREELSYYQNLLSEAHSRIESLTELSVDAAQPIVQQLEMVQHSMDRQNIEWQNKTNNLQRQLAEYQELVVHAKQSQAVWAEKLTAVQNQMAQTRVELDGSLAKQTELHNLVKIEQAQSEQLAKQCDELNVQLINSATELENHNAHWEHRLQLETDRVLTLQVENEELRSRIDNLDKQLINRIGEKEEEEEKSGISNDGSLSEQKLSLNLNANSCLTTVMVDTSSTTTTTTAAIADSNDVANINWRSNNGPLSTMYQAFQTPNDLSNQALLDYVQSIVHMREGECAHWKREVERLSQAKEELLSELAKKACEVEKCARLAGLKTSHSSSRSSNIDSTDDLDQLQQRYNTLLVLYGKVTEENNELKMDLVDLKEVYRTQIDMILKGN